MGHVCLLAAFCLFQFGIAFLAFSSRLATHTATNFFVWNNVQLSTLKLKNISIKFTDTLIFGRDVGSLSTEEFFISTYCREISELLVFII
jgi:hypothetical protein